MYLHPFQNLFPLGINGFENHDVLLAQKSPYDSLKFFSVEQIAFYQKKSKRESKYKFYRF